MMSSPATQPVTVGELLRRRLQEMKRSPEELAEAVEVPVEYISDVITGSREAPLPGRTDVYERMTSFLRLSRHDLVNCVRPKRSGTSGLRAHVRRQLLALCEPKTARQLEQRRGRRSSAELFDILGRLLNVAQGAVRRALDDHIQLRLAAAERGSSYVAMRLKVLDFLDATPATLTDDALTEFLEPRVALWDVELETGVLRVVLRPWERSRRPSGRVASSAMALPGPDVGVDPSVS
jgi:hypothetical protein